MKEVDLSKFDNSWYKPGSFLKRFFWHIFSNTFINSTLPVPMKIKILILEGVLQFSTIFGGNSVDRVYGMGINQHENKLCLVGESDSTSELGFFGNAYDSTPSQKDAFLYVISYYPLDNRIYSFIFTH